MNSFHTLPSISLYFPSHKKIHICHINEQWVSERRKEQHELPKRKMWKRTNRTCLGEEEKGLKGHPNCLHQLFQLFIHPKKIDRQERPLLPSYWAFAALFSAGAGKTKSTGRLYTATFQGVMRSLHLVDDSNDGLPQLLCMEIGGDLTQFTALEGVVLPLPFVDMPLSSYSKKLLASLIHIHCGST